MPIRFACEVCTETLQVGEEHIGQQARCPKCGHVQTVPAETTNDPAPISTSPFSAAMPEEQVNPYMPSQVAGSRDPIPGGVSRDYVMTAPLASRGIRFLGAVLDNILLALAASVGLGGYIGGAVTMEDQNLDVPPAWAWVLGIVGGLMVTVFLVFNWYLISTTGQSIGKKLVGTRIRKADTGDLPGFLHGVVLRGWLPFIINQFCGLFSLVDALCIFNEKHQCLHDMIATTCVVSVADEARGELSPFAGNDGF